MELVSGRLRSHDQSRALPEKKVLVSILSEIVASAQSPCMKGQSGRVYIGEVWTRHAVLSALLSVSSWTEYGGNVTGFICRMSCMVPEPATASFPRSGSSFPWSERLVGDRYEAYEVGNVCGGSFRFRLELP